MTLRSLMGCAICAALVCTSMTSVASATLVTINSHTFELDQFSDAAVSYRADAGSSVTFDGKLWDNAVGVDFFTLGELASGQFGSDPGDQVSLNSTPDPDWLRLDYGTAPVTVSTASHLLVIYEITSSTAGVDTEGTSFKIKLNNGIVDSALIDASVDGDATFYSHGGGVENVIQIVFDLYDYGFSNGDTFQSLYIENTNSGSGTSDPDFIFAGVTVPEPGTLALLCVSGLALIRRRRTA